MVIQYRMEQRLMDQIKQEPYKFERRPSVADYFACSDVSTLVSEMKANKPEYDRIRDVIKRAEAYEFNPIQMQTASDLSVGLARTKDFRPNPRNGEVKVIIISHMYDVTELKTIPANATEKAIVNILTPNSGSGMFLVSSPNSDPNLTNSVKSIGESLHLKTIDLATVNELDNDKISIYTTQDNYTVEYNRTDENENFKEATTFTEKELNCIKEYHLNRIKSVKLDYFEGRENLWHHAKEATRHLKREEIYMISLDKDNQVRSVDLLGQGSICESALDFKKIQAKMSDPNLQSFKIFHNHPSGHIQASQSDQELDVDIRSMSRLFNKNTESFVVGHDGVFNITDNRVVISDKTETKEYKQQLTKYRKSLKETNKNKHKQSGVSR